MSDHARRILTPGSSPSRKRKERDVYFSSSSAKPLVSATAVSVTNGAEPQPNISNRLLAGYMAHEFLTKATVFGQKFDPVRRSQRSTEAEPSCESKPQSYADVSKLLKSGGAHVPGIVNPTQLGRWIQM